MNHYEHEDAEVSIFHGERTTLAHLRHGDAAGKQVTLVGEARLAPGDRYDPEIGRLLAAGRALERLGLRMQRQARGLSKHADDVRAHRRQVRLSGRDGSKAEWHGIPPGGWPSDERCLDHDHGLSVWCSRKRGHDGKHVGFYLHDPAARMWGTW